MAPHPKVRDEAQNNNRVHIGQIYGVRPDDGLITVRLTTGGVYKMPIPLHGFSMPTFDAQGNLIRSGFSGSWIRYMPQVYDYVKVAFGPDNRPEVVGYACWGDLPSERGPRGHLGGYAQFSRGRQEGVNGLDTFFRLNPGEWDLRSSGNAYVRGSQFGTLLLAGQGTQIELNGERDQFNARSGLFSLSGAGARLRLGQVKRTVPPSVQDEIVAGSGTEFDCQVGQDLIGGTRFEWFRTRAGDLRDSLGVPEIGGPTGALPLVFKEEVYDGLLQTPSSAIPLSREVDSSGNVSISYGGVLTNPAPQVTITGAAAGSYAHTGFLNTRIDSTTVTLGSAGAAQPAVRGTELLTLLSALTVPTPLGPSGTPINAPNFPNFLSTKVFMD